MADDLTTVADITANLRAYIAEEAEKLIKPRVAEEQARTQEYRAELDLIKRRFPGLWDEFGRLRTREECKVMRPVDESEDDGW